MWLSPALCHGRESQLTTASYDVSELTCDVVLTSVSDSPSEKKNLLSEKVPLRYRWKLTANEGQRKRERTFAAQQMEADCKARAVKEDKYRALTLILLFYFFEREDIMRNYKFKSDLQNLCLSSFRLLD